MKLHLGCGTVYLDGYINIDIKRPGMFLTQQRPDLVGQLKTDFDHYYRYQKTIEQLDQRSEGVCDQYDDIANLSYGINSVHEIVCAHALEHLPYQQALLALDRWWNILKPGGKIVLAVPDLEATLKELIECKDDKRRQFLTRHILGSKKHLYAIHWTNFTREQLTDLLDDDCYTDINFIENKNFYPALWLEARKPDWVHNQREKQLAAIGVVLPRREPGKRILDVGCGSDPLTIATDCLDWDKGCAGKMKPDQKFYNWSVCNTDFKDKEFDFVYSAHCLEHIDDIVKALYEIERIGKEGLIVTPTRMTDALLQYGRIHPYWNISVDNVSQPKLIIRRKTERELASTVDKKMESVMANIMHCDAYLDYPARRIRRWFWENQHFFHTVYYWKDKINYEID